MAWMLQWAMPCQEKKTTSLVGVLIKERVGTTVVHLYFCRARRCPLPVRACVPACSEPSRDCISLSLSLRVQGTNKPRPSTEVIYHISLQRSLKGTKHQPAPRQKLSQRVAKGTPKHNGSRHRPDFKLECGNRDRCDFTLRLP